MPFGMKLSTKVTYALRAALALAQHYEAEPLTVAQLARGNKIPKSYLEQILNTLRHSQLVSATRGPKGGYTLARAPQDISVGDIIRAMDGAMEPIMCCFPESQSEGCRSNKDCLNQSLCSEMESNMQRILNGTSLQDILAKRGDRPSPENAAPNPIVPELSFPTITPDTQRGKALE